MRQKSLSRFFSCVLHSTATRLAPEFLAQSENSPQKNDFLSATMTVTIRDVALAAEVSTATVSNVLNNTGKVGSRTQRHVLATVKRLGYVPDVHARRLASNNRRTLGIIV